MGEGNGIPQSPKRVECYHCPISGRRILRIWDYLERAVRGSPWGLQKVGAMGSPADFGQDSLAIYGFSLGVDTRLAQTQTEWALLETVLQPSHFKCLLPALKYLFN